MKFTLRQIAVFATVARQESVSRAADALSLSQSATSTALAELERIYETPLFDRIGKRFAEQGRADDNPETFKDRLAVYNRQTAPLLPYYTDQGKLTEVDGMGDIASVAAAIDAALDA